MDKINFISNHRYKKVGKMVGLAALTLLNFFVISVVRNFHLITGQKLDVVCLIDRIIGKLSF